MATSLPDAVARTLAGVEPPDEATWRIVASVLADHAAKTAGSMPRTPVAARGREAAPVAARNRHAPVAAVESPAP